jgi:hypothetical protein
MRGYRTSLLARHGRIIQTKYHNAFCVSLLEPQKDRGGGRSNQGVEDGRKVWHVGETREIHVGL